MMPWWAKEPEPEAIGPGKCPATPYKHVRPGHDFANLIKGGDVVGRTCNDCGYTFWFDWSQAQTRGKAPVVDWEAEFRKMEEAHD